MVLIDNDAVVKIGQRVLHGHDIPVDVDSLDVWKKGLRWWLTTNLIVFLEPVGSKAI